VSCGPFLLGSHGGLHCESGWQNFCRGGESLSHMQLQGWVYRLRSL
jgi:hypothetical protein